MTHIFLFFAPWTKTKWFIKFAITHHSCDIYLKTLQVLVTLVKNVLIVHMTTFHHYLLLKNVDLKILLIKSVLVGVSCVNGSCCKKPLCSVTMCLSIQIALIFPYYKWGSFFASWTDTIRIYIFVFHANMGWICDTTYWTDTVLFIHKFSTNITTIMT